MFVMLCVIFDQFVEAHWLPLNFHGTQFEIPAIEIKMSWNMEANKL